MIYAIDLFCGAGGFTAGLRRAGIEARGGLDHAPVALSNPRILTAAHEQVTFRYRVSATKKTKRCTLPATAFIGRFLQHVLPRGFVKVRYFGLFHPSNRHVL